MVDRFEKFSFAIWEITRLWHKIAADEMEKYGLRGPYALYFTTMYKFPEGITAAKLGEYCGRDKADVSRAISQMEKNGLVKRTDEKAYRAKLVLTDTGLLLADKINQKAKEAVDFVGHDLSDAQRDNFYKSLELIVANLRTLSKGDKND